MSLLGGLLMREMKGIDSRTSHGPRVVAWVDYDTESVRKGVAKFAEHLNAQHFEDSRRVELRLVSGDLEDPAKREKKIHELIATNPALIVAPSAGIAKIALESDSNIPIYFAIQSDPVREGLVPPLTATSLITGYTYFAPLDVKIMELIRRVFPGVRHVGVVATDYWLEGSDMSEGLFQQAKALGLELEIFNVHDRDEIGRVLASPRAREMQAWYVPYSEIAFHYGEELTATLGGRDVPTVYARRKFIKMGGLVSVQSVDEAAMDVWAKSIANILNGVPAGSIPVMRPKEIEIAVNAAALGRLDAASRGRLAHEATVIE
jgi:ABC-type uncharacterized transport system substrate-binding protein